MADPKKAQEIKKLVEQLIEAKTVRQSREIAEKVKELTKELTA
jgi:hypothetical protein